MTTNTIVNGAGLVVNLGTDDLSTRVVPVLPEQVPQHLPLYFLFAKRGNGRHLTQEDDRHRVFGMETFDPRSVYFNHATLFANESQAVANPAMIQRVIPADAGPRANAVLWLDVLPTTVDLYQRNPDGTIFNNVFGDPIVVGTAPGHKVKWIKTFRNTITQQGTVGDLVPSAGDQTDPLTLVQSTRYPIMEFEDSSQGSDGNNTGVRLWAPTTQGGNQLPTKMMAKYQAYPFYISVLERGDPNSTPRLQKTIFGEQRVLFTFKKDVVNPITEQALGYDKHVISSYNLTDDPRFPQIQGRLGKMYVYDNYLDDVLTMVHTSESSFITADSDITADVSSRYLINFITGVASNGAPYQSFVFVDSSSSVRLSEFSNVFMTGGSDGTMTNEVYEALVSDELSRYADTEDEVQDIAYNVESVFYDSGFTLDTKFKIAQFISVRKDTVAILGTHTVGEPALTASEEHSVAIALRTRLQMFPESDYFGTPVMRAVIMGRSGIVRDNEYTKRVPATFELCNKFGKYMGAGNGIWKSGSSPEGSPGHIVRRLKDINITWVSYLQRNLNWDVGLNWILRFDRRAHFIPHYKTVYEDDTSVLNSIITAFAIAQVNKVANACWRFYVGRSDLSPAQLCDRCNAYIRDNTNNRFDNRFIIIPAATLTDMDKLRGFSWSLPVKVGADNMRTVMTTWVEAYRKEDLLVAN